ncbi:MAG TPA: TadE/TadG family type IV pilus assembly protein [Acidimicrobiales bacterium]|nr:TadE/TadG family type IV pilus assembly protein [Acidimicrobiales bacterium]
MTATSHRQGEGGQASVELALTLPVVALLLLAVLQVALLGRDYVLVTHATRAAAREAAVDRRPASVRHAALIAAPTLKAARVSTETSYRRGSPGIVNVRLQYRSPTDVPLVGPLLPDVVLSGNAAIRDESDT